MKTCQQCDKEFDPVNERPCHPAKYCSRACRDEAQRTLVTLVCVQCHQEFRRKAYMAEWSKERGPFCSFDCYGAWQSVNVAGSANPNYSVTGVSRGGRNHHEARSAAITRDGQCVECGSSRMLHVHHIDDPDDHALDNLETLCASCHRKRHPVPHGPDGRFVSIQ